MADEIINELMPNSSESQGIYAPEPDDADRQEEAEEDAEIATSLPIIEDVKQWFDEQIAVADSIRQAQQTAKTHEIPLEDALVAHGIVATLLQSKRDELMARVFRYERKNNDDE